MMKVFHLIDSGGFFGAERVLLTLAEQQKLHGYDVTIISYGYRGQVEKAIEIECQKHQLPLLKWRGGALTNLTQLTNKNRDAIFHSHGYKFNILLAVMTFFYKNLIAVATVHGYTNAPRFSKLWFYYLINTFALRILKGSAFVSTQSALASKVSLNEKNIVVYNGISNSKLFGETTSIPIPKGEYLVAVGRLSAEKAFNNLILAFNIVSKNYKDLSLVIVGDGPEKKNLVNMIEANSRIVLTGHMDNPIPIIEGSRAVVISSISEGLPIVLLEAMRAGIDIISTKVGAIPDVINNGKNGILCEPGDYIALSEAIDAALNYRKGTFGTIAKDSFNENFTAKIMFTKYQNWYQEMVKN